MEIRCVASDGGVSYTSWYVGKRIDISPEQVTEIYAEGEELRWIKNSLGGDKSPFSNARALASITYHEILSRRIIEEILRQQDKR
jgi:hypothetical protein